MKLKEQFENKINMLHYSRKTKRIYWRRIVAFIEFHKVRSLEQLIELAEPDIEKYLSYLAKNRSASTQNQALHALLFLYKHILGIQLNRLQFTYAKKPKRLPDVFSHREALQIINQLSGSTNLIAKIMYGSGLRLAEVCALRVKDIDFDNNRIIVKGGKGDKDRYTLLPGAIKEELRLQINKVELLLKQDLQRKFEGVILPQSVDNKFNAVKYELSWQYLFPQKTLVNNKRIHIHHTLVQKAVKNAIKKSGVNKFGSCHTFRHSFASEYLRAGGNIKRLQQLLGHNSLRSTMIYSHIVDLPENDSSPLDKEKERKPAVRILKIA